jgi:hypothetical protein
MSDDNLPFALVPIEATQDDRLTLEHLRVLVAVLSFRNRRTDVVFPSREELAERSRVHPNNVSKAITELIGLGWIVKTRRPKTRSSSNYEVTVPEFLTTKVADLLAARRAKRHDKSHPKVAESATSVGGPEVADSATSVVDPEVADSATPEVADSATSEVADSATSLSLDEETKEETKEETSVCARATDQPLPQAASASREHTHPPPRFVTPSVSEVSAYCQERANHVDPERFVDWYASKGWMIGKNPMRDWKAAIRTWEKNQDQHPTTGGPHGQSNRPVTAAERQERFWDERRADYAAEQRNESVVAEVCGYLGQDLG